MYGSRNEKLKKVFGAVAAAGILTGLAASGILDHADQTMADVWYQQETALSGDIALVSIDQKALEDIGPYSQWGRDIIAMTLDALNRSAECRPAVIGIDVLYTGETQPEADEWLAEAAGRYGNVVTACAAEFLDGRTVGDDGNYHLENFAVVGFDQPYEALRQATEQGHINAMYDGDGILRHHLLQIRLPDGREIPSFALAAARKFREANGGEAVKLPATDHRGFWYLPFSGKPGEYSESVSVADLISGEVSPERFEGKIVLIGPYAAGLQDSYMTAIDHARAMYGVEYQANAIEALLRGEYKYEAGKSVQLAVLFVVLMLTVLGFWHRQMRVSTVLWAAVSGGYLLLCRLLYGQGIVLHVLWIPECITILYVACIAANYILSALEKRRLTNTFKHYVAPEIVNEILKESQESLELGGRLTRIAVLFVDVRGFTPMSEILEPPQVVEILNSYLTLISSCIIKNGGTLDKFIGDAAMAFWGAPLPQKDYVMKAVRAAEDMVKGSEELCGELQEKYGCTVAFGIGIHVGEAVVGNIGSPERMDYTAIGDTVNMASRLEENAPAGTIYISREVADELAGRIRTTSLGGTIRLKGKKEGIEVLTMDGICCPQEDQ